MNKIANILDQQLSFFEYNENYSPTLIMVHGNSLNVSLFKNTAQATLFSEYRIILIELPGHGDSMRSEYPEKTYSVLNYINLLVAFIKEYEITNYVLFGHSLGGHIAINAMPELKDIKGLAISGTPPLSMPPEMEACFLPNPAMGLAFKPELSEEELTMLAENYTDRENESLTILKEAIVEADPLVRPFIGKSIATEQKNDEAQLLQNANFPVAIIHGESDQLVNLNYLENLSIPNLWRNKVQVIKKASHCPFLDNRPQFNSILSQFLKDCF